MAFAIGAGALVLLMGIAAILGTFPILHRESPRYELPDLSRLMSPLAAPVELRRGRDRAILFLHGYPATPFAFREPCAWADEAGYDAFAPLLPGCGTSPQDFTKVNASQFAAFVRDVYGSLRPAYREFHLVGSSMGGSLLMGLAEEFADGEMAPTSLSTVGSPITLFSPLEGVWTYPHAPFARTLGAFKPSMNARVPDPGRNGEDGSEKWLGYVGVFPRQTYSLILFLRNVRKNLGRIRCPVLNMHCDTDRTVDFRNQALIVRSLEGGAVKTVVARMDGKRHSRHDLFLFDSTRRRAWEDILSFIEENASS